VEEKYPDGIDELISNAGVGPTAPPEKIFALNFYAGTYIAEGLRPLLSKKKGCCVMTSSDSIVFLASRKASGISGVKFMEEHVAWYFIVYHGRWCQWWPTSLL